MGDVMSLDQLDKVKADTEEILEGINKIGYIDVSSLINVYKEGVTASEWTDVVNISGSGKLYAAAFFNVESGAYVEATYGQIIIDGGEPFIFAVPTSDVHGCGIVFKDVLLLGSSVYIATSKKFPAITSVAAFELLDDDLIKNGYARTSYDDFFFLTNTPITFNKSLLVQAKGSGKNYKRLNVGVSYVLTE